MAKRSHEMPPEPVEIEVEGGVMLVNAHGDASVNVRTRDEGITVRGVPIKAQNSYLLQDDGTWKPYHEIHRNRFGLGATRLDRGFMRSEITPAMEKTMVERMSAAVAVFVAEYPAEMAKGEAVSANNAIHRLDKEIAEHQDALDKALAARRAAEAREAAALERIQEHEAGMGPRP